LTQIATIIIEEGTNITNRSTNAAIAARVPVDIRVLPVDI